MLTKDFTGVHLKMFQKSRCAPSVLAGWDKLFNNIIERHVTVSLTLVRWLITVNLVMSFLLLQKSFWSNGIDMSHKKYGHWFPFLANKYICFSLTFFPSVQAVLIEFSDVMLLSWNNADSTEMQEVTGWAGIWALLLLASHTAAFSWHTWGHDEFFPRLLADEARK